MPRCKKRLYCTPLLPTSFSRAWFYKFCGADFVLITRPDGGLPFAFLCIFHLKSNCALFINILLKKFRVSWERLRWEREQKHCCRAAHQTFVHRRRYCLIEFHQVPQPLISPSVREYNRAMRPKFLYANFSSAQHSFLPFLTRFSLFGFG